MTKDIPTADFLAEVSAEGAIAFEVEVLEGPLFKKIVRGIEDAALNGYTRYSRSLHSNDDMRKLEVVQTALKDVGFYCEIETVSKRGLLGQYNERYFIIDWSQELARKRAGIALNKNDPLQRAALKK